MRRISYPMTYVDELAHLGFHVVFNRQSGFWIATRNVMFSEPCIFSGSDLQKLCKRVKQHLIDVHFSDNDQKTS